MTAPKPAACRLILVAAVLIVFGRLLLCDFTYWDDQHTIHHNPQLNPVQWDTFVHNWTTPSASIYIPLTFTVWAMLTFIARVPPDTNGITLNPMVFHGTSVLIHALGALAAFSLLRRLTKNDLAALLGALLWAVHPVQVESVGWASGLKDVLSGVLVLATLSLYVKWRQGESASRGTYTLALVVYVLAMLAKPSAFTTPLIIIAIDRLVFGLPWKRIGLAMVPLAVVTLPIALIARSAQPAVASGQPAWVRPFVVGDNLVFYAGKILAPIHLTFDYGRPIDWMRQEPTFYVAWLLPAAVAIATFLAYRRANKAGRPLSPLIAVGLLAFVFAPLHVLGLTRFDFQVISAVADHYLYVALIGPAMLLAWAICRWPKIASWATVLIAIYAVRAAWQTATWQDSRSLYSHTLAVNPKSWTAYINLAVLDSMESNFEGERRNLQRAEEIRPDDPTLHMSLLAHSLRTGNLEQARLYGRKLVNIYNQVWLASLGNPFEPYARVLNALMTEEYFDEAENWLREAAAVAGADHPGVRAYATRLAWLRQAKGLPPSTNPVVR